jgi:hypothetical protein
VASRIRVSASQLRSSPKNPQSGAPSPRTRDEWTPAKILTYEELEAGRSPAGGFTRATTAAWGVPWPLPKGWKEKLLGLDGWPVCPVHRHKLVKPNIHWTSSPLPEHMRWTETQKKTGLKWTPHCIACGDIPPAEDAPEDTSPRRIQW